MRLLNLAKHQLAHHFLLQQAPSGMETTRGIKPSSFHPKVRHTSLQRSEKYLVGGRKKSFRDLKNDASRFRLVSCSDTVCQSSLLARIKEKELAKQKALADKNLVTPQQKYDAFLFDKATTIYDIIYHIHQTRLRGIGSTSHSMRQLCQSICNSLDYPISEKEATDIVRFISKILGKKAIMVSKDSISVLKLNGLDRDGDIKVLSSRKCLNG